VVKLALALDLIRVYLRSSAANKPLTLDSKT